MCIRDRYMGSDTHPKVKEIANSALKEIGQTIKNPEISENVDILIKALSDPYEQNKNALSILLKTRFAHMLDPPALSFVMPVLEYALRSRVSEAKQDAAQIVGSISRLIKDPRDLASYTCLLYTSPSPRDS
eukprot:TRINITY_DN17069_c0_g1_i1.p1 TRINITY_DN17069_c0_g1~~TRINITY_DN17069_c0_g1_i1.p1  ORF type:complete len:139 (-),score=41.78 TRINITY_DN17069_c0_g1_i1:5-397(-)